MNTDNVASLLDSPIPEKLTKVGQPMVSDLIQTRRLEEANKPAPIGSTRLPYMTYDEVADDEIYDPTDFHTVGNKIRNNVAKAIHERFPVVGDKYTLAIENLAYEKPKNLKLANEKSTIQQEKSLMDSLRGDWVLYDTATGKEIERKHATILNVPRMTSRGTFIRNGSELGLKHMFRLRPGIYARIKSDGTPAIHINPAQTTGRQMSLLMDQQTGVMTIKRETRTYGVLPLLKAAGVSDDTIKAAWGNEVYDMNYNKFARILANPEGEQFKTYTKLWNEGFLPILLDEETTLGTMGKAYPKMNAEVLLGASNKVLKLSRSMSSEDEDDRDSLAYQRVMGPADYIPERIVRDGGGLLRKLFQRVVRDGNLDVIESGAFQPQVDSVFTEDKHAGYIDGASPFEGLDFASGVSRIGEGGIGDVKAAPAETRGVNDSYLGFIDPIRSPESLKVGLEVYLTYGVKKDSKGNLYANFIDKSGKSGLRPMNITARSIIATPEYYDPQADPEEFIPAFYKGKGIEYVQRKDVDYYLASANNMMSAGAGMIPNIGGIRSNRTLMGCLHPDTMLDIYRGDTIVTLPAKHYLTQHQSSDKIACLSDDYKSVELRNIRGVVQVPNYSRRLISMSTKQCSEAAVVTFNHKCLVSDTAGNTTLKLAKELKLGDLVPVSASSYDKLLNGADNWYDLHWVELTEVKQVESIYDYAIDLDVNDSVYALHSGIFTHNSKYPLQALSLANREIPWVQRQLTADGQNTTTEAMLAKQLGAKFSPVDGRVIRITDDEIVVRDSEGNKHFIDLYNMYPANQKGFLHNTPVIKEGDRVTANQLLADSNYTKDGVGALGTNLKVAFMTGHGAELFEDAIAISESCAKKLASEQLYKFRGDLTSDTQYDKTKFMQLFGTNEYTAEQLEKIDENGMPKVGVKFQKGDPVFLGIQIRDLSTSGLSRNASVPYVKTWEHDAEGEVVDVVKGRKHMTIYTRAFTPMQLGDKMCYDDKTEIMTKRGWILFQDLLADDQVLTLDIRTGENYFSPYEAAFKYYCEKEKLYRLVTKNLDIATTIDHKHLVSAMNNSRYLTFQTSEQIYGKQRFFLTNCNLESPYSYSCSRDDVIKEKWESYTGWVYCITVPQTHTMFVRRNGKTVWSGNSGRYGDKSVVSCFDSNTYVFTNKGFKPFPELTTDDEVAVLDPETNTAHFEKPKAVQHAEYEGEMYGFSGQQLDWLVTPTHYMWCRPEHNNHKRNPENAKYQRRNIVDIHNKKMVHRVSAQFLPNGEEKVSTFSVHHIPGKSGSINKNNEICTFDIHDFAAFLGIYLAEGCVPHRENSTKYNIYISQAKTDEASQVRRAKIAEVLDRMGLSYSKDNRRFILTHKSLALYLTQFGKSNDKFIPEDVFTDWPRSAQLKFIEFLYMGDGDSAYINDRRYSTVSPRLRDDLIRLCTILGYRANAHIGKKLKPGDPRNYDMYRVSISDRQEAVSRNSSYKTKSKGYYTEQYKGTIHCCSVSTGVIYVSRNGKAMWCGNSIIPDNEMPRDENGEIYDAIKSPLSLPSRLNTAMLGEVGLAKVAKHIGRPIAVPDFIVDDTIDSFVDKQFKKYGISPTTTVYDPRSNKHIEGVTDGYMFHYKLKHMSELKERGRGTGIYSSEEVPLKGEGAARRLGMMETSAVYSGGGMDVLRDAKLIRGQRNDEFWRDYRDGKTPDIPSTPLVHKKFFAHLVASGANIERNTEGFKLSAATNEDLKELTGNREITQAATFDSKNMQPISGGMFDPEIFGADGDLWGYYQLPEPVLNPLMFKPVASILGWSDTELREYLQGIRTDNGKYGPEHVMSLLDNVDLKSELRKAKELLKSNSGTLQQRDLARKRIRAISPLLKEGTKPTDLFFTRMPILPPRFRTVSVISGGETNIAADINFLYKRMIDAAKDLEEAKAGLPDEYQVDARTSYYNAINAVVGLMPTDDPKLEAKGVGGLLKWAFGKGSPKASSLHRKVFGSNLDLGGLGTITPDSRLTIDQVGIPEESAWKMYEPFVVRELRQRGYSMVDAMRRVEERHPEARKQLLDVMSKRPVLLNRAPTLWRYGIQGLYPVITEGRAIRVNPNICAVYNADFDGDSVRTSIKIAISSKIFETELDNSHNGAILSPVTNQEDNMLHKEANVKLVNVRCAIQDVPHIEESAVQISDTVTEWDVPDGVFTEAVDRVTGKKVVAPVTKLSLHKDVEMYDIQLATYGAYKHIITVSKNDTLLTYRDGEIVITDAENATGSVVPRAKALDAGMNPDICAKYIRLGKQVPLSYELGVFIGMMAGDGWVDSQDGAWLAAENKEIQDWMLSYINDGIAHFSHNGNAHIYEYMSSDRLGSPTAHRIWISTTRDVARDIKAAIGCGAYNKKIPMESLAASKAHRIGILVGLIATDGSIHYSTKSAKGKKSTQKSILFHTTSTTLRDNIIDLCNSLGIKATATPYRGANSLVDCYAVNLSVRDAAKLYNTDSRFRMIAKSDEEPLSAIAKEISEDEKPDSYDIVPFPKHISTLFNDACRGLWPAQELCRYKKQGFLSRDFARVAVDRLKSYDYTTYTEKGKGKPSDRKGYTPEQVKQLAEAWIDLVDNEDVCWEVVTDVTYLGKMDGWDITVPGPLTFALGNGTFVQDSMTTHVPVSQSAIDAINKSMLPSRNLLSPKNFKAHFVPKDAANEGLYLASRIGKGNPVRFRTEAEAQAAYDRGEIKIDTPITIG